MKFLMVIATVLVVAFPVLALPDWVDTNKDDGSDHCSAWVKQRGVVCNFAGSDGWSWKRKCTDWQRTCSHRNRNICDEEHFCGPAHLDPNVLSGHCTDWYMNRGDRWCTNKETGRDETRYDRACIKGNVPNLRCGDWVRPY